MRILHLAMIGILCGASSAMAGDGKAQGAHAFSFTAIEGGPLPLQQFDRKVLLVVNTASLCGYTYQYAGLQDLWERYRERGLVVLGVPSGDFGGQELGSSGEIKEFCEVNFDVDFPLTEREHVRGPQSHPLFAWFRERLGDTAGPSWNFHKYLVGRDGAVVAAWPSSVEPDAAAVTKAIEAQLGTPAG
jgi:glutathione peroxidase